MPSPTPPVDPGDVQGLVLRGYNLPFVCHFTLRVKDDVKARRFIHRILPIITTAEEDADNDSCEYCLNIAFTFQGLHALKIGDVVPHDPTFNAFREGAIARAEQLGDVGESDPDKWRSGKRRWEFDVMLSLHANTQHTLDHWTAKLESEFAGGYSEVGRQDRLEGELLKLENKHTKVFHFGFVDGIAQPIIDGVPRREPDGGKEPNSPPGAFLLGYPSQWRDYAYPPFNKKPSDPHEKDVWKFWRNGSFFAFRMLKQDVIRFEQFLTAESERTGLNRELLAAKLLGRWRNGKPLTLAQTVDSELPVALYNDFDYSADAEGYRCPFGAHIRRANPRDDAVASSAGTKHRLIRRGMPYGPMLNPLQPDGIERGLLGLFICVNLHDQFEFVMKNWINLSGFNGNLAADHRDPLVGSQNESREFVIPGREDDTSVQLSQFVTTRGAAYCFLPSITALRRIAGIKVGEEYGLPEEERIIEEIADLTLGLSSNKYRNASQRIAHPKSHGSVKAVFTINDKLPEEWRVGIFGGRSYEAAIRFSNADMIDRDDTHADLRGMAIKLLLPGGEQQDFLLVSHKVFFSRDPKDFLAFTRVVTDLFNKSAFPPTPDDFDRAVAFDYARQRPIQKQIFIDMQLKMTDPLTYPYYSQVPYRFGEKNVVKYRVNPTSSPIDIPSNDDDPDRLRHALETHLREQEVTFDFQVQFQTDPATMPIEDAVVEWDEEESPFVSVATITIPKQELTDAFESWSFRPWHALKEHAPLGGINRVRRAIYEKAAELRNTPKKATTTASGQT